MGLAGGIVDEGRELLGSIIDRLDSVKLAIEQLQERVATDEMIHRFAVVQTDGSGNGTETLTPPPGVIWFVTHWSGQVDSSGFVNLFLNEIDTRNHLDGADGSPTIVVGNPSSPGLYIPQGNKLVTRLTGMGANGKFAIHFIIREVAPYE